MACAAGIAAAAAFGEALAGALGAAVPVAFALVFTVLAFATALAGAVLDALALFFTDTFELTLGLAVFEDLAEDFAGAFTRVLAGALCFSAFRGAGIGFALVEATGFALAEPGLVFAAGVFPSGAGFPCPRAWEALLRETLAFAAMPVSFNATDYGCSLSAGGQNTHPLSKEDGIRDFPWRHHAITRNGFFEILGRLGQGFPGAGLRSARLPGLSFHSSASAGASPLRMMFGHAWA